MERREICTLGITRRYLGQESDIGHRDRTRTLDDWTTTNPSATISGLF